MAPDITLAGYGWADVMSSAVSRGHLADRCCHVWGCVTARDSVTWEPPCSHDQVRCPGHWSTAIPRPRGAGRGDRCPVSRDKGKLIVYHNCATSARGKQIHSAKLHNVPVSNILSVCFPLFHYQSWTRITLKSLSVLGSALCGCDENEYLLEGCCCFCRDVT